MLMNAAELSSHMLARRASGIVPQERDFEINPPEFWDLFISSQNRKEHPTLPRL